MSKAIDENRPYDVTNEVGLVLALFDKVIPLSHLRNIPTIKIFRVLLDALKTFLFFSIVVGVLILLGVTEAGFPKR